MTGCNGKIMLEVPDLTGKITVVETESCECVLSCLKHETFFLDNFRPI